jgi:hypothetical protein
MKLGTICQDTQRDRLVQGEHGAAVERGERLSVELERDDHHRAGRPVVHLDPRVAVAGDRRDPRVPEDPRVEAGSLLGGVGEPRARAIGYFNNNWSSSR